MNEPERKRREWYPFLVFLPLGIALLICIGQVAIGLNPFWQVNANMRSSLDPYGDFLTKQSSGVVYEPIDSAILTIMPGYLNPAFNETPKPPINVIVPPEETQPPPVIPSEPPPTTTTQVVVSPPPGGGGGGGGPPSANLAISKTDGSSTYTPGAAISYQIVVTNGGPDNAPSFNITDAVPAAIAAITAGCSPAAKCGSNGSSGNTVSFTGASLNVGNQITITVNGTVGAGASGSLSNTASISIPGGAGYSDPNTANNSATDTDTPLLSVDLSIVKDDGSTTYAANSTFDYTVTVTNNSATAVTGAAIHDAIPSQVASWSWACTNQSGGASGCSATASNNSNFNDLVDLPGGSSITYTVTANIPSGVSGDLVNTATVSLPSGYIDSAPLDNSSTDTDTPGVDLVISKNVFGVTAYTPGTTITYTIVVTNNGTFTVNGGSVVDAFPAEITTVNWTCSAPVGATCTANGTGNINDSVVLPPGSSVTYTADASISASASGPLANTATITAPAGLTETAPLDNTATITEDPGPNIGGPDTTIYTIPDGGALSMLLASPIVADSTSTPDFVYYEYANFPQCPSGICMDLVLIEVSADGINWSPVFYWGDPGGLPDTNSNVDIGIIGGAETENREISLALLYPYPGTGVTIDLDSVGLHGSYSWIRINAVVPGSTDGVGVDSIQPYYP